MIAPDFWAGSAEALELTIEGNRLLAAEMADLLRRAWRRYVRLPGGLRRGPGRQPMPPA
ncbi:MAG TPA: hypothetical protein PLD10_19270 [Rhodopila sp.]|nr:hypothetical protein [Rhodopila sp.]